jgi:hypothetical protein
MAGERKYFKPIRKDFGRQFLRIALLGKKELMPEIFARIASIQK